MTPDPAAVIQAARAAAARRDWQTALQSYRDAVAVREDGETLEGLGRAHWWLGDPGAGIGLCERALEHYTSEGDFARAADLAVFLAGEYRIAGNATLANGWLARARRFLEGCEDCVARSWLHIECAKRAQGADAVQREAQLALECAQRVGDRGLEACSLAHLGLAHIARSDVEASLATMDEAIAVAMAAQDGDALAVCDASCTVLMSVCLILDFPGLTVRDRDAVASAINWPGQWADGCLAHGAGTNDGNLRVVELWDSRGHWERFLAERLQQGITEALGDRARPPQITEVEFERFDTVAR